ncbi:MAG: biotin--[acetyl-CoA-carboxylase] ligase [Pseudomonadota bacterium]
MKPADHPLPQFPTPADIAGYITTHEIPARCRHLPENEVRTVFRYGAIIGSVIHSFPSLDRGMDEARRLIDSSEKERRSFPSGMVILAENLSNGKGRFQRCWHAPPGGVWMTLVLVNTLLPEISRLLPLAAGVACCETLREFGLHAHVKWVNDVHVSGRKVAGILMETVYGKEFGEEYILVGAGLNVNNTHFPPELENMAVSMAEISGCKFDLHLVITDLLAKFAWNIGLLCRREELQLAGEEPVPAMAASFLLDRWRSLTDCIGRKVLFGYDVQLRPQFEARVVGIDDEGGIILHTLEDNIEITEYAGEIVYLD